MNKKIKIISSPARKRKTKNYLNNKDLLNEIEESKYTFCAVKDNDKKYKKYDAVIENKMQLCSALFFEVKKTKEEYHGKEIPRSSIVIRVMTDEHIDDEYSFEQKGKRDKNTKLNFDPFKHYVMNDDGKIEEVVRSHWKGDIENGHFCMDHGFITDKLGKMIMLLVEKIAQKSSYRGYSWLEDIKGKAILHLLESVLKFQETKSSNPFAYFTTITINSFKHSLNIEHRQVDIKTKVSQEKNPGFQTFEQAAENEINDNCRY